MRIDLGWKSITGAIVGAIGYLSQPEVLALLPERVGKVVMTIGGILAVVGFRHAIAKASARP